MDIYNAMMRAADHMESHPKDFNFFSFEVPNTPCGTPGCVWGWIGFELGMRGACNRDVARACGSDSTGDLYAFISQEVDFDWHMNARLAAKGLRLYAAKYHAPKVSTPDWNALASAPLQEPVHV